MDNLGAGARQRTLDHSRTEQVELQTTGFTNALRRTQLSNERTYLAWWRTGITAFAVSIGTAKVVPAIANGPRWSYSVLGAAFAIVGLAFLLYGVVRYRQVDGALNRGVYVRPDRRFLFGLTFAGSLLGIVILIVILGST